jgi:hypothetical protein
VFHQISQVDFWTEFNNGKYVKIEHSWSSYISALQRPPFPLGIGAHRTIADRNIEGHERIHSISDWDTSDMFQDYLAKFRLGMGEGPIHLLLDCCTRIRRKSANRWLRNLESPSILSRQAWVMSSSPSLELSSAS